MHGRLGLGAWGVSCGKGKLLTLKYVISIFFFFSMCVDGLISTTSVLLLMISMVCYLAVVYSYILLGGVNTLELFFF